MVHVERNPNKTVKLANVDKFDLRHVLFVRCPFDALLSSAAWPLKDML